MLGTACCDGTAVSIHCSWTGSRRRRRLGDPGLRTERGVKEASLILDATAETSGETRRLPCCLPRSLSRFLFSSSSHIHLPHLTFSSVCRVIMATIITDYTEGRGERGSAHKQLFIRSVQQSLLTSHFS